MMLLPGRTSSPTLAGGERSAVAPAHGVLARGTVGVVHATTTVGPERVEVATASSLLAGGDNRSVLHITGEREGADRCTSCDKKAFERHHDDSSRFPSVADELMLALRPIVGGNQGSFYIDRSMWGQAF